MTSLDATAAGRAGPDTATEQRLAAEREFHDARFAAETEEERAQSKYYAVIDHGKEAYRALVRRRAVGQRVVEYGSGIGTETMALAGEAALVTGLDISEVAVNLARVAAHDRANMKFEVANAEVLPFADGSLDLAFASGVLHHLDMPRAVPELARVLRPGGSGLFWEPLGYNPALNLYRLLTPSARTPDERPLRLADIRLLRRHFSEVRLTYVGLLTTLAVPLIKFSRPLADLWVRATAPLDALLLKVPGLNLLAWYVMIDVRR